MAACGECVNWIQRRKTIYDDGSEIVTFAAPEGHGHCTYLNLETISGFGCNAFFDAAGCRQYHEPTQRKSGAPWQHFVMIPCPDCRGNGSEGGACRRCAGTGNVRRYDDGYVGEEQTRLHPKERDGADARPKCRACARHVEPTWVACPACGSRLMPPAETEIIADPLGSVT